MLCNPAQWSWERALPTLSPTPEPQMWPWGAGRGLQGQCHPSGDICKVTASKCAVAGACSQSESTGKEPGVPAACKSSKIQEKWPGTNPGPYSDRGWHYPSDSSYWYSKLLTNCILVTYFLPFHLNTLYFLKKSTPQSNSFLFLFCPSYWDPQLSVCPGFAAQCCKSANNPAINETHLFRIYFSSFQPCFCITYGKLHPRADFRNLGSQVRPCSPHNREPRICWFSLGAEQILQSLIISHLGKL